MFSTITENHNQFNKDICFDDFDDFNEPDYSLLQLVCYGESRGEVVEGIAGVIEVVKNRIESKQFPSMLDSVLVQKYQFHIDTTLTPTEPFKALVDSLYQLPTTTPYLYFVNFKWAKKAPWMYSKKRKWVKIGNHHFSK